MVKADELSFLCNWPQFMMAQDGHTAQAEIQALNILSPGPQSSLMPMVFFYFSLHRICPWISWVLHELHVLLTHLN